MISGRTFNWIDLLVVVVVIAILAFTVTPNFAL